MTRKTISYTIVLCFAVLRISDAQTPPPYSPPVPASTVAELTLDWHDAHRNRDVPVRLYFPKEGAGPFPIIIFSHGLGGSREGYSYLGRHWAGCGYVSLHIQHLGSDDEVWKDVPLLERTKALKKSALDLSNAVSRPQDVKFAIDEVSKLNTDAESPLKNRLDTQTFAIAGHSFGGYTTLAVSGQTFINMLGGAPRLADPRLKAAIQMSAPAPRIRRNLDKMYDSITIPMMHMTGTLDFSEITPQTKAEDRRIPFDNMHHSETCLVIFKDGDHMIFSGRPRVGSADKLAQDASFQKLICTCTTAFWDAYLKSNTPAKQWLLEGGFSKLLADQGTFETKRPAPKKP